MRRSLLQVICVKTLMLVLVSLSVLASEQVLPGSPVKLPESEVRHSFLAIDESRSQMIHVDQNDSSRDWTIQFPARYRDCQLIGGNKVLVSTGEGYREYSLDTRQMLKDVKGFRGIMFARRRVDGSTVIGGNVKDGVEITELDPQDKTARKASFASGGTRLGRLTSQGTVLFGSGERLMEVALDGRIVKDFKVDGCKWMYQALRRADGHLLAAGGYSFDFVELAADGKVIKRFGGKDATEAKALGYHFFGGFQVLKNGNVVVANWTGHGAQDSNKGAQLLEFNPEGKLVWAWHDPKMAGSINGVIVLDDINISVLNDDISGILGPVTR